MSKLLVKNLMTEKITVASTHHKFSQILDFFNLFNIRHLPVTENDKVIGIISIRDMIKTMADCLQNNESVTMTSLDAKYNAGNLMTPSPIAVTPETSLEEAIALLSDGGFHALPVIEADVIKGIITEHDMLMAYHKEKQAPMHYEINQSGFGI
jgi:CBS domain-containing protein